MAEWEFKDVKKAEIIAFFHPISAPKKMSKTVQLTKTESLVLAILARYKCVSAEEIAYWSCSSHNPNSEVKMALPVKDILAAVATLEKHRLVVAVGGLPKRWKPRQVVEATPERASPSSMEEEILLSPQPTGAKMFTVPCAPDAELYD